MAQIQSRVFDVGNLMSPLSPFIQAQIDKQKEAKKDLIAFGAFEDIANSAPPESDTYKEYHRIKQELEDYSADLGRGDHIPGYNAAKSAKLFREYGKITGQITRINKDIEDSRTLRGTILNSHPTAIFQQNDITENIDELAKGKRINNFFTDSDAITKVVQDQAGFLGKAIDNDPRYAEIKLTKGYSVEVLQNGGIDVVILDKIWRGEPTGLQPATEQAIKDFISYCRDKINYENFDKIGKRRIDDTIKAAMVGILQNKKLNVIDSGAGERARVAVSQGELALKEKVYKDSKKSAKKSSGGGRSRSGGSQGSSQQTNGNPSSSGGNTGGSTGGSSTPSTPPTGGGGGGGPIVWSD